MQLTNTIDVDRIKQRLIALGAVTDSSNERVVIIRCRGGIRPDDELLQAGSLISRQLTSFKIQHTIAYSSNKCLYIEWERHQT